VCAVAPLTYRPGHRGKQRGAHVDGIAQLLGDLVRHGGHEGRRPRARHGKRRRRQARVAQGHGVQREPSDGVVRLGVHLGEQGRVLAAHVAVDLSRHCRCAVSHGDILVGIP